MEVILRVSIHRTLCAGLFNRLNGKDFGAQIRLIWSQDSGGLLNGLGRWFDARGV